MKKIFRAIYIFICLGAFSIVGTNCVEGQFNAEEYAAFSSLLPESSFSNEPITEETSRKNTTPYALLSAPQILSSLQQVTETPTLSNSQNNEFNNLSGMMAAGNELELINGPMLLAVSSFSGEMCNGLVAREAGMPANDRKYFKDIDFSQGPANLTDQAFNEAVRKMARAFWGRDEEPTESALLSTFKSEFVQTLNTQQTRQANMTRSLMLGACTGMLASFDTYTY